MNLSDGARCPGMRRKKAEHAVLLKGIISMIVTVLLRASIVSTTPDDAAEDFLAGLKAGEEPGHGKVHGQFYINFICNVGAAKGREVDRMDDPLFEISIIKIDKVATKG